MAEFLGARTDNPTGSVRTDNPTGSVRTDNPTGSVRTDNPTGSVCTDNPTGSVSRLIEKWDQPLISANKWIVFKSWSLGVFRGYVQTRREERMWQGGDK